MYSQRVWWCAPFWFQLCSPPLQLKGILIGWGMSAASCTEQEPIMLAAGWCISDVLSSWVLSWRLLSGVWEGRLGSCGLEMPSCFLCMLGITKFSKGCAAFLWLKRWYSERPNFISNSQKCHSEERGWWNSNLFMAVLLSIMWNTCLFISCKG